MRFEFIGSSLFLIKTGLTALLVFFALPVIHEHFVVPRLSSLTIEQLRDGEAGQMSRVLNRLDLLLIGQCFVFAFRLVLVACPYGWRLYMYNRSLSYLEGDEFRDTK